MNVDPAADYPATSRPAIPGRAVAGRAADFDPEHQPHDPVLGSGAGQLSMQYLPAASPVATIATSWSTEKRHVLADAAYRFYQPGEPNNYTRLHAFDGVLSNHRTWAGKRGACR